MRNFISAAVIAAGIALAATACSSSLSSNGSTAAPAASSATAQPSSPRPRRVVEHGRHNDRPAVRLRD